MTFDEQTRADFEAEGPEAVRLRVQSGLVGTGQIAAALQWLREQDAEAAARANAIRSQTIRSETAEKRKRTIIDAIIIVLAASTLIAQVLSWLYPRG